MIRNPEVMSDIINGVVLDMELRGVCDECGSRDIDNDGYCMHCGLLIFKDKAEETYWQWINLDINALKGDGYHNYRAGLPWVECKATDLDKMMDYPEAIEFLESLMVTGVRPVDLGDTILPPTVLWRVNRWRSACDKLLALKCGVPGCYKMSHRGASGRRTKTGLCRPHMETYNHLARMYSSRNAKAKHKMEEEEE